MATPATALSETTLARRLNVIRDQIDGALNRSRFGRRPVTIIGASKSQRLNSIRSAAELGVTDMGENYAQELLMKAPLCLDTDVRWHFIGRLQSNKIKYLLPYISTICSLDSLELAEKISRARANLDVPRSPIPTLIQVNLGSERQKSGLPPAVIENLFEQFLQVDGILISGLMCIPPQIKDAEKMRSYFTEMKRLFDVLKAKHNKPILFQVLSMGMSKDFEVAIEEGATCVRIGEALFGPRPRSAQDD